VTPRLVRPSKPTERAFCGQCHSEGAESARTIPRVSMETHGEGYLCWQCHYPHYPETR
jgi:ribosomal protein S27AE